MDKIYAELKALGADVDAIKTTNPSEKELTDLLDGILKISKRFATEKAVI